MIDYSVVLDENERQRMLSDGYLPEVIDYHARERFEKLQADFQWKNAILGHVYEPTSYFDFVGEVFPGLDRLMVVTAEVGYREMDVDELMDYQAQRDDVFVVPASFINGHNASGSCKDVYALVIDIDRISPETLQAIIQNGNLGGMTPLPTYIVNSGRGVHFYYVFEEPVPYYRVNRPALKEMYRVLCGITKKNILAKTDWHALTQPFRLPGSLTRLGQLVSGWKCGSKWSVKDLAARLGVNTGEMDLHPRPLIPQREYAAKKAQQGNTTTKKKKKRPWVSSMAGKIGFYQSCLRRCYEETQEGSRYRSLTALTVVARKVEYPKEQLEMDLLELLEHYNRIGKVMKPSEVKKALRMYNDKALMTPSETLEDWFGWEFHRDAQKRREQQKAKGTYVKRSRSEICKRARKFRDIDYPDGTWINKKGAPTAQQKVRQYRAEHPEARKVDCIRDTGLSKPTVYKWWEQEGEKQ